MRIARQPSLSHAPPHLHPSRGRIAIATADECEAAFHDLAARLEAVDPAKRNTSFDRSLSCTLTDPDVSFGAHLHDGLLTDIRRVDGGQAGTAQVKLRMTGADLLALVAGDLSFASAWSAGRVKIDAKVLDLVRLRSVF